MTRLKISPDLSLPLEAEIQKRLKEIRDGMEPWYRDINRKRSAADQLGRTAAEFIRRLTGSEGLSLSMHSCLTKKTEMDELMAQSRARKGRKKS